MHCVGGHHGRTTTNRACNNDTTLSWLIKHHEVPQHGSYVDRNHFSILFQLYPWGANLSLTLGMMSGCVKKKCLDISIFKDDIKYVIAFDLLIIEVVCCFCRDEWNLFEDPYIWDHTKH